MKPVHLVILIAVGLAMAISVSFYGDTSQYVCFNEADAINKEKPNRKLHVVCSIDKNKPQMYDPKINANHFEFYAVDTAGTEKLVIFNDSKPSELDKTDKIVIIGYSRQSHFEAVEILKKCPSKYEKK